MNSSRTRWVRLAAVTVAASMLAVGCGGSDDEDDDTAAATSAAATSAAADTATSAAATSAAATSAAADTATSAAATSAAAETTSAAAESSPAAAADSGPKEKVTLRLNYWGDFGLDTEVNKGKGDTLAKQYMALNPHVTIRLNPGDYAQQHQDLQKNLIAGSGAADIAAIDEGYLVQFKNQPDKFVNLLDRGAGDYESKYLEWKWQQATSPDGKVIGLGTDVGGQAMCYRTDLFAAAGLPTDRAEVSKLWPDWDAFIETGKKYKAGSGGKTMVDAATNIFNPILSQQEYEYFDENEKFLMEEPNSGPKVAFDMTTKMIDAGISANLTSFTPEWNAAFKSGKFATLACPAWMQAYIQGQAPTTAGKWDIAAIPGGGGNWGGSFWTIPAQGKNLDEAYKLVEWLVAPEQQIAIFRTVGNLPSQPALYEDPAIKEFKNPFFSNAPVGQIFSATALALKPQYKGKKSGPVRTAVENVLRSIEGGKLKTDKAWAEAVKEAQKAAK